MKLAFVVDVPDLPIGIDGPGLVRAVAGAASVNLALEQDGRTAELLHHVADGYLLTLHEFVPAVGGCS